MNEPMMDAVMQRIDRLEREARRWRLMGLAGLLAVAALLLMGQVRPGSRVVDAETFILRDASRTSSLVWA